MLMAIAADDPEAQARFTTFRAHLEQLGWTDKRNVQIETRFGGGDADRMRKLATELVGSPQMSSWPMPLQPSHRCCS